jgi:hypothetical protein
MRITWRLAALVALSLAACGEGEDPLDPASPGLRLTLPRVASSLAIASDGARPSDPEHSEMPGSQPAVTSAEAPLIYDYRLTAYIGYYYFGGLAEASSRLEYYGHSGRIDTGLKVLKGTQTVAASSISEPRSEFFPWRRTIQHVLQVPFPDPCGVKNESRAYFEASMPAVGTGSAQSLASRNAFDIAELPPCAPPPEVVGRTKSNGVDDTSGWSICWYQIWYDSNGIVIGVQELYCEPL